MVGVDPQRRLKLPDRLVEAALFPVGQAQVEVRIGIVGVDPQRRLVRPDRLIGAALSPGDQARL